LSLPVWSENF